MSDREPVRMVDDDQEAEALRVDLARAAEHDVGYDVAAGVAAFEASLADAPAGAEAGATGGGLGGGKLLMIVVGVAGIGAAAAIGLSGSGEKPAPVVATADVEDPRPAIVPEPPVEESPVEESQVEQGQEQVQDQDQDQDQAQAQDEVEVSEPAVEAEPKPRPRVNKPKPKVPKEPEPTPAVERYQAEMKATDRARKALASSPKKALELARAADKEFPGGLFVEQRAGIKALALLGMGKADAGRKAAEAYLRKHPKGTYADKLRGKLDEKP